MDATVFPLGRTNFTIFCVVGAAFLLLQFFRTKYWYQLVLAAAFLFAPMVYLKETNTWFYGVGIMELILLLAAIVVYIVQYRKAKKLEKARKAETEAETE